MFISEKNNSQVTRTLFIYIGVTLFVTLFSGIYEMNSNNVYAFEMAFAWIYPLFLGVGMYLILKLLPIKKVPGILPASGYHFTVFMVTMRSIFIGVIKIYGTTNTLMTNIYTVLMWILLPSSLLTYLFIIIFFTVIKKDKSFDDD